MTMPVSAADMAELRRLEATLPESDTGDLAALQSTEEVLGYVIAVSRAEGWDESDAIEIVARSVGMSPADARSHARTLGRLGYRDVCARLQRIAGKRRNSLAPLT
jgi:hypothetical protein